jgi:hypothetical protein
MKPMNFTEWLKYQQNLFEISMDVSKDYSTGMDKPNADLTATANRIVTQNPNIIKKMGTSSGPKQAFNTVMQTVTKAQPHLNVNKRKNLPIGDIAKAVGDVAGITDKGV